MNSLYESIYTAILEGDLENTQAAIQTALIANEEPGNILDEGMIAAMKEVGKRFEEGDFYVPEMLISARAMKAGLALLKPHLVQNNIKPAGKVTIGSVKGDLHDIGKNLVSLMLEGGGFEVKDLGVDVPPEKFVEAISEGSAEIVAISALLTTSMQNMKTVIESIQQAGLRDKVRVIIGGAPVTQEYATSIGADGYSADASQAVRVSLSLLKPG
jgi:5-methyltetrahydrofolate--homocysteine methyltransferase